MHHITLKALDRPKHRFIWMRKSCLSRARALCRCIEQCSKPHCAGARLQGMRLFLENDVIVKYSECAHPPPSPPPPCSLELTGRLQQQHPERPTKKKNRAKLRGYRGLGGERKRYKNIYIQKNTNLHLQLLARRSTLTCAAAPDSARALCAVRSARSLTTECVLLSKDRTRCEPTAFDQIEWLIGNNWSREPVCRSRQSATMIWPPRWSWWVIIFNITYMHN